MAAEQMSMLECVCWSKKIKRAKVRVFEGLRTDVYAGVLNEAELRVLEE